MHKGCSLNNGLLHRLVVHTLNLVVVVQFISFGFMGFGWVVLGVSIVFMFCTF